MFLGWVAVAACSETVSDACDRVTGSNLRYYAAVVWPSVLFVLAQLVPWGRSHRLALVALTVALAGGFWVYVLVSLP